MSNIFLPLSANQEAKVNSELDTTIKCKLCACGKDARKSLDRLLRLTSTPDEIWRTLRSEGHSPKLQKNNLDYFSTELDRHILICLRENVGQYKHLLRERASNEKLNKDLENQIKARDIEIPSQVPHIEHGTPSEVEVITASKMKTGMSELLPALLLNNLRILKLEQDKYLVGERTTPPDLKALDSVLKSLKSLIGSAEIAELLRD